MNDASGDQKDVYPIGKKNPTLPFYPAVRAGDFLFVCGQVAKDPDGNMISGTIEDETQGTIEAIRRILAEEGATLSDIVPSPLISTMRATSAATIGCSPNTSKMRCWLVPPSKRARSSTPKSRWTPSRISRAVGDGQ